MTISHDVKRNFNYPRSDVTNLLLT